METRCRIFMATLSTVILLTDTSTVTIVSNCYTNASRYDAVSTLSYVVKLTGTIYMEGSGGNGSFVMCFPVVW
jgi:hypothetical protein